MLELQEGKPTTVCLRESSGKASLTALTSSKTIKWQRQDSAYEEDEDEDLPLLLDLDKTDNSRRERKRKVINL